MKYFAFASRNRKEVLRDPLTLLFGMGLPAIMIFLFSLMQKNMPVALFQIENITPGVIVFSFSFITLFSGMLVGKDRSQLISAADLRFAHVGIRLYDWICASLIANCGPANCCVLDYCLFLRTFNTFACAGSYYSTLDDSTSVYWVWTAAGDNFHR